MLTGWLAFDDIARIHENKSTTGIGEGYFLVLYVMLVVVYLMLFRNIIIRKGFILLILSLLLFLAAVLIDRFASSGPVWQRVGEDGIKFVGISLWTAFHSRAAWLTLAEDSRTRPHRTEIVE